MNLDSVSSWYKLEVGRMIVDDCKRNYKNKEKIYFIVAEVSLLLGRPPTLASSTCFGWAFEEENPIHVEYDPSKGGSLCLCGPKIKHLKKFVKLSNKYAFDLVIQNWTRVEIDLKDRVDYESHF